VNVPVFRAPGIAFAGMLGLLGCVSQGSYDKLQSELEASQSELEARNATVHDGEKAAQAQQEKQGQLEAELDHQKDNVRELQLRLADLHKRLSATLKDHSALEASVTEMTAALAELEERKEEADARLAELRNVLDKFRGLIHAGKLKVKVIDGRIVVVLASDVLFGSGSAALSKDGKAEIAEVSKLLASLPKRKFQVEGHTDNVPIATAQYPSNWELAAGRAITVVKTMMEAGMPANRVSAAAFADAQPAVSNDTAEGRAANRRIEVILVPDLSTLPGFDELNRAHPG
jgi:chemotaxis protein MotB